MNDRTIICKGLTTQPESTLGRQGSRWHLNHPSGIAATVVARACQQAGERPM